MKIESLVAVVTAVGSPDRAERAIFGGDFGWAFFGQFRPYFVVKEPLCDVGRNPLLSPIKNFT